MRQLEPISTTRPDAAADAPSARPAERGATHFLLGRDLDPQRESARITVGFIALAAVSAILLNIGIYQDEQRRELKERWSQLENATADKVVEVRTELGRIAQVAELISLQTRAAEPERRAAIAKDLAQSADALDWADIEVRSTDGTVQVRAHGEPQPDAVPSELVARASRAQRVAVGVVGGHPGHPAMLAVVVPLRRAAVPTGTLVAYVPVNDVLRPMLRSWPGFGPSAGAYLVGRDHGQTTVLSSPPTGFGLSVGAQNGSSAGAFRAAAMAANGVESRVEVRYGEGEPLWTVTRFLPEIGCGVVGQARRSELDATSNVMAGLIALDVAMVILVGAAVVFWRRQYESGLAQRELEVTRRHANQIQGVFDNAFDAILSFDRNGRIRTANAAAEKIFNRPCADLYGQPLSAILRSQDERGRFKMPAPGHVIRTEALHPDGTEAPIELSIASSGEGDDPIYTAIARDTSKQVEAENQIRTFAQGLEASNRRLAEVNAQLEEASRLKSEFLANTSHELRTPLNGMIGFLQLVLDGMCSSPEEERDFLRQALNCSRHLLGLINDVLDIAKIEAGKLTIDIQNVDVPELFDEVYTVTHVQAAQKGVELVFQPPERSEHGVRGDFRKIKQVLINLVGNAIKFTPSGRITVRASEHGELGHCMFEVVDTGIGIAPDRQSRIFEKFIQGDGSTTRMYGGTGLGLAISRSLIELMGGIIGVHSDGEGKGTRMYFSLPTWHEEADDLPEDHAAEQIDGPPGGPLVLVVEDDPIFRRYLGSLLHKQGYRTVEARHAEGGWLLARRLRPAVVVLDYALSSPEGATLRTGWDLAERMTSDAKTRHIPLIFVTGFDEQVKDKLRATAFARKPEHMVKPIDGSALLEKIESMLGSIHDRTIRILMADDDPSVVAYIRKALPEERYHIEVANNGEECLHVLRVQPRGFDLLLLDLMMPGVSGYDVLRELTLSGQQNELLILVLTNFPEARNEEERRILEQGLVLDVLPKSSVHDNPMILPHIIDWHMQVKIEADSLSAADNAFVAGDDSVREEAA